MSKSVGAREGRAHAHAVSTQAASLSLSLSVCVLGALVNGVDQCYGRRTAGRIEKTRAGDCARPIARDCAFQRDYISLEDFIGETRSVCVVLRVPWRPIRCASDNRR